MESFIVSVNAILPLVIMAFIGFYLQQKKLLSENTFNEMNKLCFKLFLPALLFYNTYTSESDAGSGVKLIIFALVSIFILFLILMAVVPFFVKDPKRQGSLIQAIFRSNYVLLGMPIASVVCGEGNVGITATAAAFVVPLYNVLSVIALATHTGQKLNFKTIIINIVKNPLIDSAVLGLVFMLAGIRLPEFLSETIYDVGKVATPLSIITLGGSLALSQAAKNRKALFFGVFSRLVVVPGVILSIAVALGYRGVALVTLMTIFASPTAVNSFVMAKQMGCDGELAGELVLCSTVAAAFTMFIWIFSFSSIGLI